MTPDFFHRANGPDYPSEQLHNPLLVPEFPGQSFSERQRHRLLPSPLLKGQDAFFTEKSRFENINGRWLYHTGSHTHIA